jgi:hypothetical protein
MNLTPGQLYFITEQDVRTGARSNYYKIGIVRDAEGRDSKDRLLEHQTGNPRKLCVVETLNMPAVEHIETNLHYLYARNRVMGEWMQFTDSELKAAIAKANELKVEMEANLPDIKRAEELKEIASNGTKLAPTHDSEYWHEEILTFREVIDTCNEALEKYDDFLKVAIEKGVAAPGVAKVQQRTAPKKFDEKLFKSKYPDLYKKYASEKIDIKGQFRITTPKDWAPDVSAFGSEQVELITDFTEMLDSADDSLDTGFALHEKHLAVLEVLQYAEWREEIADIKLRVLTGEYDGIDGTCSWKREAKTTTIFDKKSLQTEHPDEYNECVIEGKATEALIVEPKAALVGDQN